MEVHTLLADRQIARLQLLRYGVQAGVVVEVDERSLPVLQLVERRRLLKLAAQVGELVVMPYLLQAKLFALLLVPGEIEVQTARILTAIGLRLWPLPTSTRQLARPWLRRLPAWPCPTQRRDEDGHVGKPVLSSLITGHNEHLGIEVRVRVIGDLLKLQRVFVAVVRHDVNVSGCVRELWLDADEAAGYMAAIKHPVHRVAAEDSRNLLLGG